MQVRLLERLRARLRLRKRVGLVYHPGYANDAMAETARAAGADPYRGEKILGVLIRAGLLRAGDLRVPTQASLRALRRVHEDAYLEEVTTPEVLGHIFGLPPERVRPQPLLSAQRFAVGGTMACARAVVHGRRQVMVNLGGGFHHAEPAQGGGFCVYNDIAAAIAWLRSRRYRAPIAIVDLDYHQGNGNLVAFARDASVLTYSLHGSVWSHIEEPLSDFSLELPSGCDDAHYLSALEQTLPAALERHRAGLVFVIAGNDVLSGDSLGGFSLTLEGLMARDRFVIDLLDDRACPLVITLGGGYQQAAWQGSSSLLRYLLTGVAKAERPRAEGLRRHFSKVYRKIDSGNLQREADAELELDFSDVLDDLSREPPARRFLDFYTVPGAEYALERYGILDLVRALGYCQLQLSGDLHDRGHQILRLHGRATGDLEGPRFLLVELVAFRAQVKRPVFSADGPEPGASAGAGADANANAAGKEGMLNVLWIEWLLLQHPLGSFRLERPRLPGQQSPGLGIAGEVLMAMVQVCKRVGLDGLLHRPAHFHNAVIGARLFRFLDPEVEGRFRALRSVLDGLSLAEATEAVEVGRVLLGSGQPLVWEAGQFYLPVSEDLRSFFASKDYERRAAEACEHLLVDGLVLDES